MRVILAFCMMIAFASLVQLSAQTKSQESFGVFLIPKNAKTEGLSVSQSKRLRATSKLLFTQDDLWWYNRDSHSFLALDIFDTKSITKTQKRLRGKTFGVFVGDDLIYTGKFLMSNSSQSYSGTVIDLEPIRENYLVLSIRLGYPNERYFEGTDSRSDSRILNILQNSKKLYENLDILARGKYAGSGKKRAPTKYFSFEVIKAIKGEFTEKEIELEFEPNRDIAKKIDHILGVKRESYSPEGWQFNREKHVILNLQRQLGNNDFARNWMFIDIKAEK